MKPIKDRLTYANVMATVAVFIALGGSAYAATQLKKNSVGAKQLKVNAVTTAKIKNEAVTTEKIKNGAVTGSRLANGSVGSAQLQPNSVSGGNIQAGSVSGSDINQSTLTSVRASNVFGVAMNGGCGPEAPFPAGVTATPAGTGCKVTFPSSVYDCAATATAAIRTSLLFVVEERRVETFRSPLVPDQIVTNPTGNGSDKEEPIDLILVC
jgi:hypothetical protein